MPTLPTIPLGPWPVGMDTVSAETALTATEKGQVIALRDTKNVLIDRSGWPSRRQGRVLVEAKAGLQRIWTCKLGSFAQAGAILYKVHAGGLAQVAVLNSAHAVDYAVLNDAVVVSSRSTLIQIKGNTVLSLALPDAPAVTIAANASGGLDAGRYTVAVAFVRDGTEGSLSRLRTVDLAQGQGIAIASLPAATGMTAVRVYRTTAGGEVLRHDGDMAPGSGPVVLGAGNLGGDKSAPNKDLRRMPGGEMVAAWRGRLLVVRGSCLYASEAMNYGLHSPRHGFVPFASRIIMLAPVEGGVFVGTRDGVTFLQGARPRDWKLQNTGGLPPVMGSQAEIDGNTLSPGMELGGQRLVLWLAPKGYVLGTASGQLIELQADRMDGVIATSGRTTVHGRRVTTAIQ